MIGYIIVVISLITIECETTEIAWKYNNQYNYSTLEYYILPRSIVRIVELTFFNFTTNASVVASVLLTMWEEPVGQRCGCVCVLFIFRIFPHHKIYSICSNCVYFCGVF